jgi:hypothetical protein
MGHAFGSEPRHSTATDRQFAAYASTVGRPEDSEDVSAAVERTGFSAKFHFPAEYLIAFGVRGGIESLVVANRDEVRRGGADNLAVSLEQARKLGPPIHVAFMAVVRRPRKVTCTEDAVAMPRPKRPTLIKKLRKERPNRSGTRHHAEQHMTPRPRDATKFAERTLALVHRVTKRSTEGNDRLEITVGEHRQVTDVSHDPTIDCMFPPSLANPSRIEFQLHRRQLGYLDPCTNLRQFDRESTGASAHVKNVLPRSHVLAEIAAVHGEARSCCPGSVVAVPLSFRVPVIVLSGVLRVMW